MVMPIKIRTTSANPKFLKKFSNKDLFTYIEFNPTIRVKIVIGRFIALSKSLLFNVQLKEEIK
jgi:hypothetical protein